MFVVSKFATDVPVTFTTLSPVRSFPVCCFSLSEAQRVLGCLHVGLHRVLQYYGRQSCGELG